ncbi:hypothetical protein ACIRPT_07420 [Streptomyces sp. NPDC101227]|uniref:hypothetical protein n=1 Tax=Streptomyces sp. NPDC101227 TaxID=3366136 RepID=UPI0038304F20
MKRSRAWHKNETQTIEARGKGLVAALAGDEATARRHTDFFVFGRWVDEGIPYWDRAAEAGDAFSAYTLARYRKIRGDRPEAERLYRLAADRHSGCAYGLAVPLRENGDPEAASWFRAGWDMGRLDCKIELGKLLAAGGKPAEAAEFLMAWTSGTSRSSTGCSSSSAYARTSTGPRRSSMRRRRPRTATPRGRRWRRCGRWTGHPGHRVRSVTESGWSAAPGGQRVRTSHGRPRWNVRSRDALWWDGFWWDALWRDGC